jgi:hypothetical protein
MRLDEWLKESKPFHLTINDILKLPAGKKVEIFFMDRNLTDITCEDNINPQNVSKTPTNFFRKGYFIKFLKLHDNDINGIWQLKYDGEWQPEMELDREFEVYLNDVRLWTPLVNGSVPDKIKYGKNRGKSWKTLDKNTLLGWRGPMMFKKDMNRLPKVYWTQQE